MSRTNISHAIQTVRQFVSDPHKLHLMAVYRFLKYVRGTLEKGLFYSSGLALDLSAYADADWAGCPDTRRSTNSWSMFLGLSPIS